MTISFFVSKNDLDQIDFMIDNFTKYGNQREYFIDKIKEKFYLIECFKDSSVLEHSLFNSLKPISDEKLLQAESNYLQVNIEYRHYILIKDYLKF